MRKIQQESIGLVVFILLFTLVDQVVAKGFSPGQGNASQQQQKCIPVSVTAEVPVGGASIGIIEPVLEVGGVPLNTPAAFFPPSEDSFITQSIALPSDPSVNRPLFVEVLFSGDIEPPSTAEATARLSLGFFANLTEPVGQISGVGGEQRQSVEVAGEGLRKATFGILINPIIAQSEMVTIQIGRLAKGTQEDTYPGVVRIQAIRICYSSQ